MWKPLAVSEDSFEPRYSSGRAEIAIKYEELRNKAVFQQCMLSLDLPMSMFENLKLRKLMFLTLGV